MTTKTAFTPEEWQLLVQAPLNVAMLITVASPSVFGSVTEMYTAAKGLVEAGQQVAAPNELMSSLFAEFRDKEAVKQAQSKYDTKDPHVLRQEILKNVQAAITAADDKATADEASQLKEWLYQFGVRQANASKEGGFLGIGAVRVSEAEKTALQELAGALGITPPAEPAA